MAFDRSGRPILRSLRAGELWIAFGCVTGVSAAITEFETRYASEITAALQRSFERALAEDAELRLRERLMLVVEDETPRLASYSGRGDLRAWLRATAVRTAIDLMRARREVPVDDAALGDLGATIDPLLAALKERYREAFRGAFTDAAARSSPIASARCSAIASSMISRSTRSVASTGSIAPRSRDGSR